MKPLIETGRRVLAGLVLAAGLTLVAPGVALADWARATSPHFEVYGEGPHDRLKAYVERLEVYDALLRSYHAVDPNQPAPPRLKIYLVHGTPLLHVVVPTLGAQVSGFYHAGPNDTYAMAIANPESEYVLRHEYAHHFMMQTFPAAYPAWLVEGYAEYFSTAEVTTDRVRYGVPGIRGANLADLQWVPFDRLLTVRPFELGTFREQAAYYAEAWIITHYFMSDAGRRSQLDAYLRQIGQGVEPVQAMETATGMSVARLQQTVLAYSRGSVPVYTVPAASFGRPEVTVEDLSPGEDALLLEDQRVTDGVSRADAAGELDRVRRLAAPFPDDPFARRALARAETTLGDLAVGQTLLNGLLAATPADAEVLRLLAANRVKAAKADDADRAALLHEARGYLVRALDAAPDDYRTLYAIGRLRRTAADFPTNNDIRVLHSALVLAPQVGQIRLDTAAAYLARGGGAIAADLLQPLANSPHEGAEVERARAMLAAIRAGSPVPEETPADDGE